MDKIKKLIISVGHKGSNPNYDPGAVCNKLKNVENHICARIAIRMFALLPEMINPVEVILLPDLTLNDTIKTINEISNNSKKGSVWAIELHKDSFFKYIPNTMFRRMGIYYYPKSSRSKLFADTLCECFVIGHANKTSWSRSDTQYNFYGLGFIRKTKPMAHIIEAGFIQEIHNDSDINFYAALISNSIRDTLLKLNK